MKIINKLFDFNCNHSHSILIGSRYLSFTKNSYCSRILIIKNNKHYMYNKSFSRAKFLFRRIKSSDIICNNGNSICLSSWYIYETIKNILE
jgi:hypothetical protein